MKQNKIEVYGIPDEVGRCPGCQSVTKLLKELNAPFTFYKVLTNNGKIEYDRPLIVSLAKRAGFTSLNIVIQSFSSMILDKRTLNTSKKLSFHLDMIEIS